VYYYSIKLSLRRNDKKLLDLIFFPLIKQIFSKNLLNIDYQRDNISNIAHFFEKFSDLCPKRMVYITGEGDACEISII
jgi:hypothetical protein